MAAGIDSFSSDGSVYFSKPADTYVIEADISDCLPEAFTELWRSEKRCDMTLSCGGEEFKVHSLVLYAYSPYFADLIDKSTQHYKVTVDCDADLVRLCLEFMYCGKVTVTAEQCERLTEAANLLCIKHLQRKFKAIQFKDITKENCLEALCFWESEGDEDNRKTCLKLAVTGFDEISETEGLMNLCSKCVTDLLTHENLAVSSPGDRLSAGIAWLEHDARNRALYALSIMRKLPLHEMTKTEIKFALRSPVVQNNDQVAGILNNALYRRTKVECLVSMARVDLKRNTTGNEVLVTPVSFSREWHKLTDLPADPPRYSSSVGCVSHGSSLYVTGLGKSNNETWVFNMSSGKWKRLCDLQNSRVSHCMTHYDGGIYVLGGHMPDTIFEKDSRKHVRPVELLHPGSSVWQHAGDLKGEDCFNSCSTVVDDGILVYGNYEGGARLLQLYKPKQKVTELFVKYQFESFANVQGIFKTGNHVILCDAEYVRVLSLTNVNTNRQVTHKFAYDLPRNRPAIYLSEDGQFIYTVGGIDFDRGKRNIPFIHRASVKEVINNSGSGWQGVMMNWPTSQQRFFPGAHCTAMISTERLDACAKVD